MINAYAAAAYSHASYCSSLSVVIFTLTEDEGPVEGLSL
jgi:hypothetical protein